MRRRPVKSSVLASAGYDHERRILELEFVSGDVYRYWIVPERVWTGLWEADSAGQYFTTVIRDAYPTEKVSGA
ncbi:KTSC domain-containing protein [Leifsonia poae]|uniref:KTSC domain-containing protein n=1 Tax=Leifsonia poae TaxID=110933 RepID=UPI0022F27EF3|nr:KTSC domain-containing protein [Leifsonia poae]